MPHNGETNQKFGVYRSLCCGQEIILPAGKRFPDCPSHKNLPTIWRPEVDDSPVLRASESVAKRTTVLRIGDMVRIVGLDSRRDSTGVVTAVLANSYDPIHRYEVRFSDGTTTRYFSFELSLVRGESQSA
jgi:hypothetical protein